MEDYKKAALNLYPEDWVYGTGSMSDFKHDNNASLRKEAERVFKYVFEVIQSEEAADGVAQAFLRRVDRVGSDDRRANVASMSTSLLWVRMLIRDGVNSE